MKRIAGQGFLVVFCFMSVMLVPVDTGMVAAFLVSVIFISAAYLQAEGRRKNFFMLLYPGLACFFAKLLIFSPAVLYSILVCGKYVPGLLTGILCVIFYAGKEPGLFVLLLCGGMAACLLSYQEREIQRLEKLFKRTRDDSKELNLLLEEKNVSLLKRQDDEIYTAKLKERNRIAREIHDNVGHMLSRAILMTGAMKAVNRDDGMEGALCQLENTLNDAMTSVRESVHDLHDDSVDLREVLSGLAKGYSFCEVSLTYDMGQVLPGDLKYSFIAIVKEALNNVARHSHATQVSVTAREHPGLYQLVIRDNGDGMPDGYDAADGEKGIGLRNMKDRIRALGGNIQFRTDKGFHIYITVPRNIDEKEVAL